LGHLAATTLEVSEPGQPEVRVQVVGCRIEGPSNGEGIRVRPEFELGSLGMLKLGGGFGSLVVLLFGKKR
jgi:hypothetical protein